jgi:hypothetical protein
MTITAAAAASPIWARGLASILVASGVLGSKLVRPRANLRFKPQEPAPPPPELDAIVLGNSISLHGPRPQAGWYRSNGMAASGVEHDFAHVFFRGVGVDPTQTYVQNLYPFETDWTAAQGQMPSILSLLEKKPRYVVVQLGDNVKFYKPVTLAKFYQNLVSLLTSIGTVEEKICLSTFWGSVVVDSVIEKACRVTGSTYVYIGDIRALAASEDDASEAYADKGIDKHPKDAAMRQIGLRLADKVAR